MTYSSQAARFAEFLERSDDVRAALAQRSGMAMRHLGSQLQQAVKNEKPERQVHWFRISAETMSAVATGMTACRSGCDACCHIPVMLSSAEAAAIGREIERAPLDVPIEKRNAAPPTYSGAGHACPFLLDSKCSIYESRPLACRLLFNLDKDALLCQHLGVPSEVPYLDATLIHVAMAESAFFGGHYIAELRDFFPPQKNPTPAC